MRHPRRNEVYRDVGSGLHDPADTDFIDIIVVPVESDAALLLCSDGLSDLVPAGTIAAVAAKAAGHPSAWSTADRGCEPRGRQGQRDGGVRGRGASCGRYGGGRGRARPCPAAAPGAGHRGRAHPGRHRRRARACRLVPWPPAWMPLPALGGAAGVRAVGPSESIAAAIAAAVPGDEVVVERGDTASRCCSRRGAGGEPRPAWSDFADARGRPGRRCGRRSARCPQR